MVNTSGGNCALKGGQQRQLVGIGVSARRVFGILKIAVSAAVGAIKQRLVHPLKVKGQGNGLTQRSLNTGR